MPASFKNCLKLPDLPLRFISSSALKTSFNEGNTRSVCWFSGANENPFAYFAYLLSTSLLAG